MKNLLLLLGVIFLVNQLNPGAEAKAADPKLEPLNIEEVYTEAERLYLKSDAKAALSLISKVLAAPAEPQNDRVKVRARNLAGLIHFQSKNLQLSVNEFESAAQLASRSLENSDSLLHLTKYNLGNALFQSNKIDESQEVMKSINPDALDIDTRTRFFHLTGNILANKNSAAEAAGYYLKAASLAKDIGARDTFLQKAISTSRSMFVKDPKKDLEVLDSNSFPSNSPADSALKILMARGYMYAGQSDKAKDLLEGVIENSDPSHPLLPRAREMVADLTSITEVDPQVIGVLLPLSGKFAKFGRLCLNAITLAYSFLDDMKPNPNFANLRIVVRDSGETPESAVAKFEELVKDERAIAVIGPLLSKQFSAVAKKAQEYGVPLFSLSQKVEADLVGSNIFPVALSPKQQISYIVTHAIQNLGYKRFSILAPDDSFGTEYVNLFWNKVEELGGKIVGIETYEPKSTDFRREIKKLLGLEYLKARNLEMEDLKRRADQFGSTLKVKGKLRQRYLQAFEPKGLVEFDALFIPDDPSAIGQIAPSLAVEDVNNIPLLGINTWNTSEIVQRAGRYLQKSIFVDGFLSGNRNPRSLFFVETYMKHFHTIPGTIEAQAYDAAAILGSALSNGDVSSRSQLRQKLISLGKYQGVSGEFEISPEGLSRSAHLLTIRGNSIVEVSTK